MRGSDARAAVGALAAIDVGLDGRIGVVMLISLGIFLQPS
jgi:hypothetical protein